MFKDIRGDPIPRQYREYELSISYDQLKAEGQYLGRMDAQGWQYLYYLWRGGIAQAQFEHGYLYIIWYWEDPGEVMFIPDSKLNRTGLKLKRMVEDGTYGKL